MDYTVYYGKSEVGTLHIKQDGLYYDIDAECICKGQKILRLYKVCGTDSTPLGILTPTNGKLQLTRRISVSSFGQLPECAVIGTQTGGFLPWRGTVADRQIDGFIKNDADGQILAVPYSEDSEYPLIEYLSDTETVTVGETACLALHLENGEPPKHLEEPKPRTVSESENFSEFFSAMPQRSTDI